MSHDDVNYAVEKLSDAIAMAGDQVADAIHIPRHAAEDASGSCVGTLTEAVRGVTAGLFKIAEAIDALAEAVREKRGEKT